MMQEKYAPWIPKREEADQLEMDMIYYVTPGSENGCTSGCAKAEIPECCTIACKKKLRSPRGSNPAGCPYQPTYAYPDLERRALPRSARAEMGICGQRPGLHRRV